MTISEIDEFLSDPDRRIATLPGRDGIGKTKLLRDWSRDKARWTGGMVKIICSGP